MKNERSCFLSNPAVIKSRGTYLKVVSSIRPHPGLALERNDGSSGRPIEPWDESPPHVCVGQILGVVGVTWRDDVSVQTRPDACHARVAHQRPKLAQYLACCTGNNSWNRIKKWLQGPYYLSAWPLHIQTSSEDVWSGEILFGNVDAGALLNRDDELLPSSPSSNLLQLAWFSKSKIDEKKEKPKQTCRCRRR